jgi:threonine dehydratase
MEYNNILKYSDIVKAKSILSSHIIDTPLIYDYFLSEKLNANIFFKAENIQRTGSFKFRGAYNKIYNAINNNTPKGILAWSSGNHAQGVAEAAKLFNLKATIVMPKDAPSVKIQGTKSKGAKIIFYNRKTENREEIGKTIAKNNNLLIVPPYDDKYVIAGQGTIGLEVIEQLNKYNLIPDKILVPTGGGGLIAGIATAIKKKYKNTNIYCVEPSKFSDYSKSLKNMKITKNNMNNISICDSLLASEPGKITFKINSELLKRGITVTDTQVLKAIKYAYKNLGLIVEPGGAVALAAILNNKTSLKNKTVIAILSGSNIDPSILKTAIT